MDGPLGDPTGCLRTALPSCPLEADVEVADGETYGCLLTVSGAGKATAALPAGVRCCMRGIGFRA